MWWHWNFPTGTNIGIFYSNYCSFDLCVQTTSGTGTAELSRQKVCCCTSSWSGDASLWSNDNFHQNKPGAGSSPAVQPPLNWFNSGTFKAKVCNYVQGRKLCSLLLTYSMRCLQALIYLMTERRLQDIYLCGFHNGVIFWNEPNPKGTFCTIYNPSYSSAFLHHSPFNGIGAMILFVQTCCHTWKPSCYWREGQKSCWKECMGTTEKTCVLHH